MCVGLEKAEGFQKVLTISSEKVPGSQKILVRSEKSQKVTGLEKMEGSCIASVVIRLNSFLFSIICDCSRPTSLPTKSDESRFWIVWTVVIELRPCSLSARISKICKREKQSHTVKSNRFALIYRSFPKFALPSIRYYV